MTHYPTVQHRHTDSFTVFKCKGPCSKHTAQNSPVHYIRLATRSVKTPLSGIGISILSSSLKHQEKMATLVSGYLTYGVPSSSDNWDGGDILFAEVHITCNGVGKFTARQEHRNQPIGNGNAIYLILPFDPAHLGLITRANISAVDIYISAQPGQAAGGLFPGYHDSNFRTEVVLDFSDGSRLATGYNDPALPISPYNQPGPIHLSFDRSKRDFFTDATLIVPIG
jgi:hypothetical protein